MEMKRTILSFSFVLAAMLAHAQLTLEGCQHSAQTNYPLVRQYGLIEKAREYNLENAGKGYLPQFTLSGKATYQSDVTKLPVDVPGIDIKSMPKDQYQVMLEVSQNIWDGGDIRSKKQLTRRLDSSTCPEDLGCGWTAPSIQDIQSLLTMTA